MRAVAFIAFLVPGAAAAQTVNLNLSAPITDTGGANSLLLGFPYGGGSQFTLPSNGEGQTYSRAGITQNADGSITFTASPNPNTAAAWPQNLPYLSGGISTAGLDNGEPTQGGFAATYGIFSAKMALPAIAGTWPAFWLMPQPTAQNPNPAQCEIDVMENIGGKNTIFTSLHFPGATSADSVPVTVDDVTQPHVYGVDWEPDTITFLVDGQPVSQFPTPATCHGAEYVLSNLAVGGQPWSWPGQYTGGTASMQVSNITYTPGVNGKILPGSGLVGAPGSLSAPGSPAGTSACAAAGAGAGTPDSGNGGFRTVKGQLIGPNGQPFIARGINIRSTELGDVLSGAVTSTFPGINFVRINVRNLDDPASLASAVNYLTSRGIVAELEDHPNGGGGQGSISALSGDTSWYGQVASYFKNNPYVWFGTYNEPPTTSASLSAWQQANYDAIRGAGNTAPLLIEPGGSRPWNLTSALDPSAYASMTNIVMDPHAYDYQSNYSTDQSTVDASVQAMITAAQTIKSADGTVPVIIGEYGNSTDGSNTDPGGMQEVNAVINSGVGSAAWSWVSYGSDALRNGDGSLTDFGQEVANFIKTGGRIGPAGLGGCRVPIVVPAIITPTALPYPTVPIPGLPSNPFTPVQRLPEPPPPPLGAPTDPPDLAVIPPVMPAPPINTTYPALPPTGNDLPNVNPLLPQTDPGLPPIGAPVIPNLALQNFPATNPMLKPIAGIATGVLSLINPIGSWLTRMDASILTGGDAALQGIAPLLTIPVTVAALLFLGARGVRVAQGDAGALNALWFDCIKLIAVIALSLNIGNYDYYVRDFFYVTIPDAMTAGVSAGAGVGVANGVQAVAATIDGIWDQGWDWVGKAWQDAGVIDFGTAIAAFLCGATLGLALVCIALVYLLGRLLLMIVLVFGPICIACSMHRQTAPIYERWMGKVVALIFLQVTSVIVLVMVFTADKYFMGQIAPTVAPTPGAAVGWFGVDPVMGITAADTPPAPSGASDIQTLFSMVVWVGMGAFALYSLPAIAYSIGTGVAVSFAPVVLGLVAAGQAISDGASAALGAMSFSGFSLGAAAAEEGLSMSLARDSLEGMSGSTALPPPPPPALSGASAPTLGP